MLELGTIWLYSSGFSSLLDMVSKKTQGDWIACGVYQALNHVIVPDRYPIAHTGFLCFSTWFQGNFKDRSAYRQIPVDSVDTSKTAITTPFARIEFVRMPFWLRNVIQTFHCFMDKVVHGLDFCIS